MFFFFCAKPSDVAPSLGLWGACWLLGVWGGLGSESLLRHVHSGLGSKQQHLGSMQQGGFGGQAGFCGQQGGFGGQAGFGGQQGGFGGQQGGFGGQGGDFAGQQGGFGGHGLHFGSHIFRSFGCPRRKRRTFSEGMLAACIHFPQNLSILRDMTQTRAGIAGLDILKAMASSQFLPSPMSECWVEDPLAKRT